MMTNAQVPQLELLSSLSDALQSAGASLEGTLDLSSPDDGISLLGIKNDLLLAYLQNLAFLIVIKLRAMRNHSASDLQSTHNEVVKMLIETRTYLEKGVRPVEKRMKYTIDQYIRAAQNSRRARPTQVSRSKDSVETESDSDASEDESKDGSEVEAFGNGQGNDEVAAGPRLLDLGTSERGTDSKAKTSSDGVYRPPRQNPTTMPEFDVRSRQPRKRDSRILKEYVDEEMASAPLTQPSIGSNNTILQHGRSGLSQRDREKERERTDYEEGNFIRLPGESKSERRKARQRGELNKRDMFGGEDWTGLGGLGDRLSRSVSGGGKSTTSALQRREKRRPTEDAPRGDGVGIGDTFEKRRRVLQDRAEKKAAKKSR